MELNAFRVLFLHLLAVFLNLKTTAGFRVKLYSNIDQTPEYKQLLYQNTFSSAESCTNLPSFTNVSPIYVETDSCVLAYTNSGCSGEFRKLDATLKPINFTRVTSLYPCTALEGGEKVRLELYGGYNRQKQLAYYDDVCGCISLYDLNDVDDSVNSMNNHGNCIRVYADYGCQGPSEEVPGGINEYSENLDKPIQGFYGTLYSMEPCEKPLSCYNTTATVINVQLLDTPTHSQIDAASSSVPMSVKAKFSNNGSAVVVQEYTSRKIISTTNEVEIGKSISNMNHVGVSASATVTAEAGGLFASASVSTTIGAAYDFERTSTEEKREKFSHTTENEFSITEKIEIHPCEDYEISSFVKVVENMPLRYAIEVEINGYDGNVRMTAADLKAKLSSMEWVKNVDNFTIVAREYASMTVSFGTETYVYAQGYKIQGCYFFI